MIEKRYSDGRLAKWYYSQTDVISNGDNEYYLKSKKSIRNVDYSTLLGTNDLLDELNRLSDKNEQLKLDNKRLLSDYTDVCNDNIAVVDENEQLKQTNQRLNDELQECMGKLALKR